MQVSPYLSFQGDCEAAFTLYAQTLGGQVGELFRYGGSPMAGDVPPDWQNKVMHGSVTIGSLVLMGADIAPDKYEAPKGLSMSLHMKSTADGERIYQALSTGGTVVMPAGATFWAELFAVVIDPYGIQWSINCGVSEET